jgi:magnesium chelatase subunit D
MTFSGFVGQEKAKLALVLNAIDPRCGGVLFVGERGSGKSTLARLFRRMLPRETPFVDLPLNSTEEGILGGIDMEEAIRTGKRRYQPGILARAHTGFVYIDDVNLLANEILALLMHAQGRKENLVEREGLTLAHDADFQLVASMNPGEAPLSPHLLDRFGMAVVWSRIEDPTGRMDVVRASLGDSGPAVRDVRDDALIEAIARARGRLNTVVVPGPVEDYIAARGAESLAAGHRGDLFLRSAARAFAAYQGKASVEEEDVDAVAPLVLDHRRRMPSPPSQQPEVPPQPQPREDQPDSAPPPESSPTESQPSRPDSNPDTTPKQRESSPREQIFDIGETFEVRRWHFQRDRVKRGASGRKLKTLSRDKRGRYVRSRSRGSLRDIALDATIRAAAPLQRARGASGSLVIESGDFRFKQREKKVGHVVVFLVDGSGSMGAQRRMVATKGAIQSLLLDSYQKRDKVAMIVFRKDRAEVVLPPTSSVERASRLLRAIPVGGKTPLSAGLLAAYELIKRTTLREPEVRVLLTLITDGRANHSMTGARPAEEVQAIVSLLGELPFTEFLVVDTENKSSLVRTDSAKGIAEQLSGGYCCIEELRSESLVAAIRSKCAP